MKLHELIDSAKNEITLEMLMDYFFFSTDTIDSQLYAIALFTRVDGDMPQIIEIYNDYLNGYMNTSDPKYQIRSKNEKIKVMQGILDYKIIKNKS